MSPGAVCRSTSYTLILSLCGLSADVIGSVAFGEQLGALEYDEQEDGSVQLVSQEFMQVWQLLAWATHVLLHACTAVLVA